MRPKSPKSSPKVQGYIYPFGRNWTGARSKFGPIWTGLDFLLIVGKLFRRLNLQYEKIRPVQKSPILDFSDISDRRGVMR